MKKSILLNRIKHFYDVFLGLLLVSLMSFPLESTAHHSFAIYDFSIQEEFTGTINSIKFRNPHISLTMKVIDQNGDEVIVDFIEGAPANMLVRGGLKPDMISVGTEVSISGSPLIEDKTKFFIRKITLKDGTEFQ
jgi:hypothetical protein